MRSLAFFLFVIPSLAFSQEFVPAGKIKLKLRKLNVLASVMYVAAHPDDENTRVITYMANDRLAATAYLSMTRGDGGQNLIGPEIRDQLGVIRTQELLAARRVDGGQQFFTRANDFGYSKSATETFSIWGKEEILADVIRIFRQYQPDVIITRFPPDERAGHGHHTASTMLAIEAFEKAAAANVYPEQVAKLGTWQARRIYFNTSRWWNNMLTKRSEGYLVVDVGGYSPLLGASFTEIAAISRSQHRSQGFGSPGTRGEQLEFLEYLRGSKAEKDIFEGVNTTWSRVKGGDKIAPLVAQAIHEFDEDRPAAIVPLLLRIQQEISRLEPGVWRERKLAETEELLQDCLGLFVEATSDRYRVAPGDRVLLQLDIVNRSAASVAVERLQVPALSLDSAFALPLGDNAVHTIRSSRTLVQQVGYTSPYWLREPHGVGRFDVRDEALIGKPESAPPVTATLRLKIGDERLVVTRPLVYRWTDPAKGELRRPLEITPPVLVNLADQVYIFKDASAQPVTVSLKSINDQKVKGAVRLTLPAGWRSEPAAASFELSRRDEETARVFMVFPGGSEGTHTVKAVADMQEGQQFSLSLQTLSYEHIRPQTILLPAEAKMVRLDLRKEGSTIVYIRGAGDDVPRALQYMGYEVLELNPDDVTAAHLQKSDAVVVGIRALNVSDRMRFVMPLLFQYARNGGTVVMQYNTAGDIEVDSIAPYKLELSRDRVTQEDAAVRMLKPGHAVLNVPNKIDATDFHGWVQERGLYFPGAWSDQFEAILSMNDAGEKPLDGSLLVARHGEGYFVYTSLSFFRELPEGVAGAYKLFANLVSLRAAKPETAAPKKKQRAR